MRNKFYLKKFQFHNGEHYVTFNIYDLNENKNTITLAITNQGFVLDGIDEELFIQDIENFPADANWDYVNSKNLFEMLRESGILDDEEKYRKAEVYCEIEGYEAWCREVEKYGENWGDDVYVYEDMDWSDFGRYMLHEVNGIKLPLNLEEFFDYEAYGESFSYDGYYLYRGGIAEIRE